MLYTYDAVFEKDNKNQMDDTIMAVISLVSLFSPIKASCKGTNQGFTNVAKVMDIVSSIKGWINSEAASMLLRKTKMY